MRNLFLIAALFSCLPQLRPGNPEVSALLPASNRPVKRLTRLNLRQLTRPRRPNRQSRGRSR
jgi:hypothetical protein